jgi:hypothetical protein
MQTTNGLRFYVERSSSGNMCIVCPTGDRSRRPLVRVYQQGPNHWICLCVTCLETMAASVRKIQYDAKVRQMTPEDLMDDPVEDVTQQEAG